MNRNRTIVTRTLAAGIAALMIAGNTVLPTFAAEPQVQVDETLYVNADFYGRATSTNVVKSVGMNGLTTFTDYGNYTDVINMTNTAEPEKEDGKLSWTVPEGTSRFYYEGKMDTNTVELPWNFDISYKLNGVDTAAEKLNGASGLVEIHIKATPNDRANVYYRNNMLLTVAVPVDMDKCYSVDAPGSQNQSVGSYTGIMFMALPGEEGDFTVRLGTDNFTNTGIIMAMVPGTLSDLGKIKDLNEAKNTWRENGNRMYDSMTKLIQSMEAMKGDVALSRDGIGNLQAAQNSFSGNRVQIENLSTEAVNGLRTLTDQTAAMIPYIQITQQAVTDINQDVDTMYVTLKGMQGELDDLDGSLRSLRSALRTASGSGSASERDKAKEKALEIKKKLSELHARQRQNLDQARANIGDSLTNIDKINDAEAKRQAQIAAQNPNLAAAVKKSLEDSVNLAAKNKYAGEALTRIGDAADQITEASPGQLPPALNAAVKSEAEHQAEVLGKQLEEYEKILRRTSDSTAKNGYSNTASRIFQDAEDVLDVADGVDDSVIQLLNNMDKLLSDMDSIADKSADSVTDLRGVMDELNDLCGNVETLIDTMDSYVPSLQNGLSDSETLMNDLTDEMSASYNLLNLVNETAKSAGPNLDAGAQKELKALRGTLTQTLNVIDHLKGVREAADLMKQTVDQELDKLEDENNFLNIDPDAEKVSFTSEQNPAPHSLQIILRTDEIDDTTVPTDITDNDADVDKGNAWTRIVNIFIKIFEAIRDFFSK
ncbi:hypothetical protein SAMN04487771_1003113 [[Clostridium] aminophilum]|uniref:X-X-X-Leu-X-X-Gly heptad repeat-containing protein n=1 Tax=[Clostridium] aminophilum TaxID=1526 RepID=A0A1I0B978_9FIRM|nr:hypothetical protein [[Clostridium] aminophilum]SET02702.1 hypothetical protein SAMN04487771_1003113 [[Clostridium] aminophilum]